MSFEIKNGVIGIIEILITLSIYILFFRFYEKRKITELSATTFGKNALIGFLTGLILQSLLILVIYFSGGYAVLHVNPVSFLIPGFINALVAGFFAEIILRGMIFRLAEEKLGTVNALIIITLTFAVLQLNVDGATILSVFSIAIEAGICFPRPIYLPGVYGFLYFYISHGILLNLGFTVPPIRETA